MEQQPAEPDSGSGTSGTKATTATTITTTVELGNTDDASEVSSSQSLMHLRLMRAPSDRHVTFHEGVIDNEGMNKRKSKCCCIYRKPHAFGESSSSSDDECEHCFGHPEVRRRNRLKCCQHSQHAQAVQPKLEMELEQSCQQLQPAVELELEELTVEVALAVEVAVETAVEAAVVDAIETAVATATAFEPENKQRSTVAQLIEEPSLLEQ